MPPPVNLWNVYTMSNKDTQNKHLAAATDMPSAITLAGALFIAFQGQSGIIPLIGVFDDTNTWVAWIGDPTRDAT
jgi:hypothetical protein